MLISEKYKEIQVKLHKNAGYGMSGHKFAEIVSKTGFTDILDYGCGKKSLEKALGFKITNYDPAIKGLETNNTPHDLVFCGDVLEHIEPEFLDEVLADIKRCTLKKCLMVISTRPSNRRLPDKRNAHLIVKDSGWWKTKASEYFTITKESISTSEYIVWA